MLECSTMMRTGVIVAMLALAGTAVADKTPPAKKQATPAKADPKKDPKAKADPPAADADDAAGAADGADVPDPMMALAHVTGPKLVDLGNSAEVDLPEGFVLY